MVFYIAYLSQWGGRGAFYSIKLLLPVFAAFRGGGASTLCSGQIFKDDVNGLPSTSDICLMLSRYCLLLGLKPWGEYDNYVGGKEERSLMAHQWRVYVNCIITIQYIHKYIHGGIALATCT
jgi:hypothetical protein